MERSPSGSTPRRTASTPTSSRWDEGGFLYGRTVFDPLAVVTAAGKVEPYLAESITHNADYTSFTITLRPGIMFHDGTPLRCRRPGGNLAKQKVSPLVGPAFAAYIAGSSVTGPLSVTVTMKDPWVPFPYYLAQAQTGYIAAPSMLNNPDGSSHPVGTGPFVFKEWVPNSHFTATANPHYWRSGLPYLDSITFKPIIDPAAATDALQSGTIDIMHTVTPATILAFRGNKKYAYYDNSGTVLGQPSVNCLMLNTASPPFNNHKLRVAMAMGANAKQYSQEIDHNVNAPINGLFLPGSPYYAKTSWPSFNPSGARKLVRQVAQETGAPIAFTLNRDQRSRGRTGRSVRQAAVRQHGRHRQHQHHDAG